MPKIKVRANDKVIRYGGVFYDYIQKVHIGAEPVEVEHTPLVNRWLTTGEIIIVEDEKPEKKEKWPNALRTDIAELLESYGLKPSDVRSMSDEELLELPGVGPAKLKQIREALGDGDAN